MKKLILLLTVVTTFNVTAQTESELLKHFEAYHKEMKGQGDVQGVINALTHLNVIESSVQRLDTLAYIYVTEGRNLEALNTIGIDINPTDSDINTEVKAIALKALNQPERAVVFYEELFKRNANSYIAYEIADLKTQLQDFAGAKARVDYGLTNVQPDMKRAFYESQQPYEVSLKSALTYMKALIIFNMNQTDNLDQAITLLGDALTMDANFNLAKISKDALEARKAKEATTPEKKN
ncbi:MAG: tetratricopeptide (TPR) repeat protein [Glaciecola sp.]|jgi:tetratricopeptide (TPR) repeat protein